MKRKITFSDDMVVEFDETPELKEEVYNRVLGFFIKMEAFSGESIMQSDEPQIEAAPFLSDLADDVFKFDVDWGD